MQFSSVKQNSIHIRIQNLYQDKLWMKFQSLYTIERD